jgi:hypothetical protein
MEVNFLKSTTPIALRRIWILLQFSTLDEKLQLHFKDYLRLAYAKYYKYGFGINGLRKFYIC